MAMGILSLNGKKLERRQEGGKQHVWKYVDKKKQELY
jgi:hypothetical protein